MKYEVYWRGFILLLEATKEEADKLLSDLNTLRQYIYFPKPAIQPAGPNWTAKGMDYEEARKYLAQRIGCSELPK